MRKDSAAQQSEVGRLTNEVEALKRTIEQIPKKIWVKAAGYTVLNFLEKAANTKAGQAVVERTVGALFGPGGGDSA